MAGRFRFRKKGDQKTPADFLPARCGSCLYFHNDPGMLEREFRGLTVLSSAYGSARGEAGLCSRRDLFLSPGHGCPEHAFREGADR